VSEAIALLVALSGQMFTVIEKVYCYWASLLLSSERIAKKIGVYCVCDSPSVCFVSQLTDPPLPLPQHCSSSMHPTGLGHINEKTSLLTSSFRSPAEVAEQDEHGSSVKRQA